MLNSPALDTAIGLVFIYLLYSLLATSIKEGIATIFGLRARMLKKGIVSAMFSNSLERKDFNISIVVSKAIKSFRFWKVTKDFYHFVMGIKITKEPKSLGDHFYNHPIIKSYGSNERFSTPSYIATENFSTVLLDVLSDYAEEHKLAIEQYIKLKTKKNISITKLPLVTKINYLVEYLLQPNVKLKSHSIDRETLKIIQLYLAKSYQNLDSFKILLEGWFDETMYRVTGWYKRQAQFILFLIGFGIALAFNVNIIAIAGKLSTDKDARDKLVSMAIKEADALKNDPRVSETEKHYEQLQQEKSALEREQQANSKDSTTLEAKKLQQLNAAITKDTTSIAALKKEYLKKRDDVQKMLKGDINDANNLLAIGWGDYGFSKNRNKIIKRYDCSYESILDQLYKKDSKAYTDAKEAYQNCLSDTIMPKITKEYLKTLQDTLVKDSLICINIEKRADRAYLQLFQEKEYRIKGAYFVSQLFTFRNFIGYLLFAIGVCLGAPFWFDLLQKLIKLRAAGKKADENTTNSTSTPQPVQVTVTTNNSQTPVG